MYENVGTHAYSHVMPLGNPELPIPVFVKRELRVQRLHIEQFPITYQSWGGQNAFAGGD
jgi:hypothetical protein